MLLRLKAAARIDDGADGAARSSRPSTRYPPKDRDVEAARARERARSRYAGDARPPLLDVLEHPCDGPEMGAANWLEGAGPDRRADLRGQPDALRALLDAPSTRILGLTEGRLLTVQTDEGRIAPRWLRRRELPELEVEATLFLGVAGDGAVFAVDLSSADAGPEWGDVASADLRRTGPLLSEEDAALWAYGRALAWWHQRHRHCPVCGRETRPVDGGHRRLCTAAECGAEQHPRTDPAVIVLVSHGDRCLLARSPRFPPGMYSTLAGFVEPGESLEDCVRREVFEEVGVQVTDVRYHSSQPWPFPQSLMVGFHARAKDTELTLDPTEIEDAFWIERAILADEKRWEGFSVPPPFAIARRLIEAWLDAESRP